MKVLHDLYENEIWDLCDENENEIWKYCFILREAELVIVSPSDYMGVGEGRIQCHYQGVIVELAWCVPPPPPSPLTTVSKLHDLTM